MKKIFYSLLVIFNFSFFVSSAQDVAALETFEKAMKPGAVLTYDVNMAGKKYQFIATIKKLGSEIAFDWKMTEPINKTGSVIMSATAISKADGLFNYFTASETKLEKETSMFISGKIFNDAATNFQASLKVNGQSDTATVLSSTVAELGVTVNGDFLSIPGIELQGGSEVKYTIGVVETQRFPLITRMDLGWTIQLMEIKNP